MAHSTGGAPGVGGGTRLALAFALTVAACPAAFAQASPHHYTQSDRYAGCLVSFLIPSLRRGNSHDSAMAYAEDKCFPLSQGLSELDLRRVLDEVNFFVIVEEEH